MRILICGDRNWVDGYMIAGVLALLQTRFTINAVIHGSARGADTLAGREAGVQKIAVEAYPADWAKFGRAAGPIRNIEMLTKGNPDLVIAFHDNLQSSKGTKDMVNQSLKFGKAVLLMSHEGPVGGVCLQPKTVELFEHSTNECLACQSAGVISNADIDIWGD